jgi:hypothetical protein
MEQEQKQYVYEATGIYLKIPVYQTNRGYWYFTHKGKRQFVHKFIAERTIPKPDWANAVTHIDRNRSNNSVSNLKWSTKGQTMKEDYASGKRIHAMLGKKGSSLPKGKGNPNNRPIVGRSLTTDTVLRFDSAALATELGFDNNLIGLCVKGKRKSHKGFIWKYQADCA